MTGGILLVDDDHDTSTILKAILRDKGYTVYAASSLEEAIAVVKKREIDLAIIDFIIPGCRGDLMARVLKHIDEKLDFIFLSGHEGVYDAVGELDFPVYETLMKPTNVRELLSTIRSLFDEKNNLYPSNVPSETWSYEIRGY